MILHSRQEWQLSTNPVKGPAMPPLGSFVDNVCHYPGSPATTNFSNPVAMLRAIQSDYTRNRGYSIGYSFAIDLNGEVWELRGLDIKPAATAGYNDKGLATFFMVPGAPPANDKQIRAFVELHVDLLEKRTNKQLGIYGHGQRGTTPTPCPGAGIMEQLPTFRKLTDAYRNSQNNPIKPFPKGKDVLAGIFDCTHNGGEGIKFMIYTGGRKIWIADEGMWNGARSWCALAGLPTDTQHIADPGLFAAMGIVEGPVDSHCDPWGLKVN